MNDKEKRIRLSVDISEIIENANSTKEIPKIPDFKEKFKEVLSLHISDHFLSVEGLAHLLCMSRMTLYRKCIAHFGIPAHDIIKITRAQMAEKLLIESNLSISQICYFVGFNSEASLYRTFRSIYGTSPYRYKRWHTVRERSRRE